MHASRFKHTFPLIGLLLIILSAGVANGQISNSANTSNQNTKTETDQSKPAQKTNKDPADNADKKKAEENPNPCDPNPAVAQVYEGVKVKNAYKNTDDAVTSKIKTVQLNDIIVVEVENLKDLLARKECLKNEDEDLVLFLDNRGLKNVTQNPLVDPASGTMQFTLVRNDETKDVWTYLLGMPRLATNKIKVSIGIEDTYPITSGDEAYINLNVVPRGWSLFWLAIIAIILTGFLYLAANTNMIRNPGPIPSGKDWRPYSLARTQAAWWFFIILASYLFIGVITGDFNTIITGTVLSLFGISAGTAVGSAFVDANKDTEENRQKKLAEAAAVEKQVNELTGKLERVEAVAPADPRAKALLEEEKEAKTSKLNKLQGRSENFLRDILSDTNGISFHRFQAVVLSVILGVIFIYQVYANLAMPDFDGFLLTLLLISSGTYLGFKLPPS